MATSNIDRNSTDFPLKVFKYLSTDPPISDYEKHKNKRLDNPNLLLHYQKSVIQYLLHFTSIRGILLNIIMGGGKTRIPVSLIQTIYTSGRKIVFIGPKGLHDNFRSEFRKMGYKCPDDRISFISLNASNMAEQVIRMEKENIQFNIDFDSEKSKLAPDNTHYSDERTKEITKKSEGLPGLSGATALDDTFVFVDEAHTLFNSITNGSKNALELYDLIMGAKNIKIIFGTGTAIVNTPFELVPCFNMLAGKKIFPEDRIEFEELFIGEKKVKNKEGELVIVDRYIKNPEIFKNRMVGLVSYYGPWVTDEEGEEGHKPEKLPMEIRKVPMSNKQFARYSLYHDKEAQEKSFAARQSGRYAASKSVSSYRVKTRMASIAIPLKDEDISKADIESDEFQKALLQNLSDPDNCPKYYEIKKIIEEHKKGILMFYCDFVGGIGIERIGKFLELIMGYEEWTPMTDDLPADRYVIISGKKTTDERTEMQKAVNDKNNMWGEKIKVILVGPAGSLGLNFKGIQCVTLVNPSFNMARSDQVVYRAVRNYSHEHLPKEYRKVRVIMLIATDPSNAATKPKPEKQKSEKATALKSKPKATKPSTKAKTKAGSTKDAKSATKAKTKAGSGSDNNDKSKFKDYVIDYDSDYDKFETVESSHYSSTMPWHIKNIYKIYKENIPEFDKFTDIIDANSNIGADAIHFAKNTNADITAVELMKPEFDALTKNIKNFGFEKRITPKHDDIYNVINKMKNDKESVDMIHFDPPWGGPEYMKEEKIMLMLSKKPLFHIVNIITDPKNHIAKYVSIKAPKNFDIDKFENKLQNKKLQVNVFPINSEINNKHGFDLILISPASKVEEYKESKEYKAGASATNKLPTKTSKEKPAEQTTDEYLYEYGIRNKILNLKALKLMIEASFNCELNRRRLKNKKRADQINCLMCTPTGTALFHDDYKIDISTNYNPCVPPEKKEIKAREIIYNDKKYMFNKDAETGEYTFYEWKEDLGGFVVLKKDDPIWSELYKGAITAKPIKNKKTKK